VSEEFVDDDLNEKSEGEFNDNDDKGIGEKDDEGFDGAVGLEGADASGVRFSDVIDSEERNEGGNIPANCHVHHASTGFVQLENSDSFDMQPVLEDNSVGFFSSKTNSLKRDCLQIT